VFNGILGLWIVWCLMLTFYSFAEDHYSTKVASAKNFEESCTSKDGQSWYEDSFLFGVELFCTYKSGAVSHFNFEGTGSSYTVMFIDRATFGIMGIDEISLPESH
jgi:hypothetical protein